MIIENKKLIYLIRNYAPQEIEDEFSDSVYYEEYDCDVLTEFNEIIKNYVNDEYETKTFFMRSYDFINENKTEIKKCINEADVYTIKKLMKKLEEDGFVNLDSLGVYDIEEQEDEIIFSLKYFALNYIYDLGRLSLGMIELDEFIEDYSFFDLIPFTIKKNIINTIKEKLIL